MNILWKIETGTGFVRRGCAVAEHNGLIFVCWLDDAVVAHVRNELPRNRFDIHRHTSLSMVILDHFGTELFKEYAKDKLRRMRKLRRSLVRTAKRRKIIKEITEKGQ